MSDKPEDLQAFPHGNPTDGGDIGMTLRDYFAGQALAGWISNPTTKSKADELAKASYILADAMLKVRVE